MMLDCAHENAWFLYLVLAEGLVSLEHKIILTQNL